MTDGSHIEQITSTIGNVRDVAARRAESIGQESMRFAELRDQVSGLTQAAKDVKAQQIPHLLGIAAEKSREAAAILSDAQAAVSAYLGHLTLPQSEHTQSPASRTSTKTQRAPERSNPDEEDDAIFITRRRELFRKAYFAKRYLADGSVPTEENDAAMIANVESLANNYARQKHESSDFVQLLRGHMDKHQPHDPFTLADKAKAIADMLYGDVTSPDMVDLAMATQYYYKLVDDLLGQYPDNVDMNNRAMSLRIAVQEELVQRIPIRTLANDGKVSAADLADRIFKDSSPAGDPKIAEERRVDLGHAVASRLRLENHISWFGFSPDSLMPNNYSKPFASGEQEALNEAAANTMEGIHLLQSYGVTPMVIVGEKIDLPEFDLVIAPPVGDTDNAYKEGVLADFFFIKTETREAPDHGLLRKELRSDGSEYITLGQDETRFRLRLHNDGRISHGDMPHNIPSDMAERCFQDLNAQNAYDRLRGLLISIAYDAVVPQDVVERTGSVASHYRKRESKAPNQEPITDLLLPRQKELRRANVSDHNRQPTGWVWPERTIDGYMRKLPEGYKARPGAEEEARKYYKDRGWAFDGLPEGKTFVGEYTRGTGPASITFRQASFRPASSTRLFLKKNR